MVEQAANTPDRHSAASPWYEKRRAPVPDSLPFSTTLFRFRHPANQQSLWLLSPHNENPLPLGKPNPHSNPSPLTLPAPPRHPSLRTGHHTNATPMGRPHLPLRPQQHPLPLRRRHQRHLEPSLRPKPHLRPLHPAARLHHHIDAHPPLLTTAPSPAATPSRWPRVTTTRISTSSTSAAPGPLRRTNASASAAPRRLEVLFIEKGRR